MGRIAAIVAVAAALAVTPAAVAAAPQGNPFLPQAEQPQGTQEAPQQEAPAQAPVRQETESDSGIGGATLALVVVGLLALIGGIWAVIVRDARRATAGRVRVQTSRGDPDAAGRSSARTPSRGRKPSPAERRRRKRGRAR